MHLAQLSGLIASYQHAYGVADGNLKRLCGFVKHFLGAVDDRRVAPAAQVNAVQINDGPQGEGFGVAGGVRGRASQMSHRPRATAAVDGSRGPVRGGPIFE